MVSADVARIDEWTVRATDPGLLMHSPTRIGLFFLPSHGDVGWTFTIFGMERVTDECSAELRAIRDRYKRGEGQEDW